MNRVEQEAASRPIPALLVAHEKVLLPTGGGVQICNREYAAVVEAAGFELKAIGYDFERPLRRRFIDRVVPRLSNQRTPSGLYARIDDAIKSSGAEFIFFSLNLFADVSRELRRSFPKLKQVLWSHGVESIDFCIDQRVRRNWGTENRRRLIAHQILGREVLVEVEQRRWLDGVLTLSPLEVEIEKWLGSPQVCWVPRTIVEASLNFRPVDQRVGCVSTLEHTPNFHGLIELFKELDGRVSSDFRFRLVGQPARLGVSVAKRFPFVDYLGPLSDSELRSEASTWCCFVHPMFVYAKGCSTKLAAALGWQVPVATTEFGVRGYVWSREALPLAESAAQLAVITIERSRAIRFEQHQRQTIEVAAMTPSIADVGAKVEKFLSRVRGQSRIPA